MELQRTMTDKIAGLWLASPSALQSGAEYRLLARPSLVRPCCEVHHSLSPKAVDPSLTASCELCVSILVCDPAL